MYDVSYVSNLTKRKNKELNWIELKTENKGPLLHIAVKKWDK
jgi:hypothetical protein